MTFILQNRKKGSVFQSCYFIHAIQSPTYYITTTCLLLCLIWLLCCFASPRMRFFGMDIRNPLFLVFHLLSLKPNSHNNFSTVTICHHDHDLIIIIVPYVYKYNLFSSSLFLMSSWLFTLCSQIKAISHLFPLWKIGIYGCISDIDYESNTFNK